MTMTEAPTNEQATPEAELADHLMSATTGTLELYGIYLGTRLGLYRHIHEAGSVTTPELAERAGIHPRYAQEWLEQQAVAGILTCADPSAAADERRYALPGAHVGILVDPDDESHLAPFAQMLVGIAQVLDEVAEAYRTGDGVPYSRYGAAFRHGQGAINRPAFTSALVEEWLPAVGGLAATLRGGGKAVDIGCGQGWSTTAIARAFPEAEVWGIDADVPSIEEARQLAASAGVRVRFEAVDASELAGNGRPVDVAIILEALHDMARPVDVLRAVRESLADDGVLVVADEAVAESFQAPGDELERMMYGWSITHCLPASMAEQPSAAIGTVIRESTVRQLASAAGFRSVKVVPVDAGFFRLYELRS